MMRPRLRIAATVAVLALSGSGCAWITEASVDSSGTEGNSGSGGGYYPFVPPAISADGRYIAFNSNASNLVAGDTNETQDVFVRDTVTGTTSRVNVSSSGAQADLSSDDATISGDGRYVAFSSNATNLVPGDTNDSQDVFVRDTTTGTTALVSPFGYACVISGDGRYVAFVSGAALVPDDTNDNYDVFLRDTVTGTTSRASVDSNGVQGDGSSSSNESPAISADGRYITFESWASNLVAGDTNGTNDVFVRDTVAGTTSRVSVDSTGIQADLASGDPAMSADGRFVAFESRASNLVAGDTNGAYDVFVRDTVAGTTSRVSVDSTGAQANDGSVSDAISADGRYVTFTSVATNLVAGGDTNDSGDVFVRDTLLGTTARVSVDMVGAEADGSSGSSVISADGRYIAFESNAQNLIVGHTAYWEQVYVRANPQPTLTAVVPELLPRGATTPVTLTGTGFHPGAVLIVLGGGVAAANVTVVSPTELTAALTVESGATAGSRSVLVGVKGVGPREGAFDAWGVCSGCVEVR
jgi:Tol biopolymer transport system component